MRRILASFLVLLAVSPWVLAQAPSRFQWQTGQVMLYKMELTTDAVDILGESKSTTKSTLKVTKKWQVSAVDPAGVATMHLTLVAMAQARTTPSGDTLVFDSANPDKSTPQLKEAMTRFLNTPLATVRIDPTGKVLEVKDAKADASSYENELPFLVTLPPVALEVGKGWTRNYKITLAPPLGTGEKYDAVQTCTCKALSDGVATLQMSTELKAFPRAAADIIPLWQMMPEGEVTIDTKTGRLQGAKLSIKKEIKNHQGEKSYCSFTSELRYEYAGDR